MRLQERVTTFASYLTSSWRMSVTVEELIKELQKMPLDFEVLFPANPECNCLFSPDHLIEIVDNGGQARLVIIHCYPLLNYFRSSGNLTHLMLAEEWEEFFATLESSDHIDAGG